MFSYRDMFQDELQLKESNIIKPFGSGYISVDSPEHYIIVFYIPDIIARLN